MGLHVTGNALQVIDHPCRGFRVGEDHGLDRFGAVGFQRRAEGLRIEGLAPLRLDHFNIQSVGAGHLDPAFAELAVVTAQHLVAAAQGVDDSRFHGSGSAAGDHQHIAGGLVQPLQLFGGAPHDGLELPAAVADGVTTHGLQHRFRHRGGARNHQGELVLHGAGDANRRL